MVRGMLEHARTKLPLVSILAFTLFLRILSFKLLYPEHFTRDADMWLIYELVDGKLLEGYTSLWHFFGLSAYSYPILFHSLAAALLMVFNLRFSDLFWMNALFSLIPPIFVYLTVRNSYGRNAALLSAFALATAPIFIFETLPGTFKARGLFYAIGAAELYFATRALERPKRYLPYVITLAFLSSLTYRASLPFNLLILPCLLASFAFRRDSRVLKVFGASITIFASVLFVLAYTAYTPSYGILSTLVSSLGKEGPLILAGIFGVALSLRSRNRLSLFPALPAVAFLIVALFNWKAADMLPIVLSLYSGMGLIKLKNLLVHVINWRELASIILVIGALTASFGLTYYPTRWYIQGDPAIYDEMAQIRGFVSSQPIQRGSIIYGTSYTGFSVSGAYSSIYFMGPEQEAFVKGYLLNHLASTNFDPWIIEHPESIHESNLQLYNSLPAHGTRAFKQFLSAYFIQYFVIERGSGLDESMRANNDLKEVYSTPNYRVYEVISTKPNMELLRYVENELPEDAMVLTPYYLDPFIAELRETFLAKELSDIIGFDHFHLLEERFLKARNVSHKIDTLRLKVEMLEEVYSSPSKLCDFAIENGFSYVVVDSDRLKEELERMDFTHTFSVGDFHVFKIEGACQGPYALEIDETIENALVINVFMAPSFSLERYFLSDPVQDVSVKVFREDGSVIYDRTDQTGTAHFMTEVGKYLIEVSWNDLSATYPVKVKHYTFIPIILRLEMEEPMGNYLPIFLASTVGLCIALGCLIASDAYRKFI